MTDETTSLVVRLARAFGRSLRTIIQGIYDGIDWLTVGR